MVGFLIEGDRNCEACRLLYEKDECDECILANRLPREAPLRLIDLDGVV